MTQGFNPYFILGSYIFSLAVINLFDVKKNSKLLNRIGNTGKICKSYTVVKSFIPKLKFDNVFDIRKSHRLYIHNVRKIHLLGFSVQRLGGKSLKISRSVSIGPLFSKL